MSNKQILEALSSDLKRVSLGWQRGSQAMANRFLAEAIKHKNEINTRTVDGYINTLLSRLALLKKNKERIAEDALMYSVLLRNYAQKHFPDLSR